MRPSVCLSGRRFGCTTNQPTYLCMLLSVSAPLGLYFHSSIHSKRTVKALWLHSLGTTLTIQYSTHYEHNENSRSAQFDERTMCSLPNVVCVSVGSQESTMRTVQQRPTATERPTERNNNEAAKVRLRSFARWFWSCQHKVKQSNSQTTISPPNHQTFNQTTKEATFENSKTTTTTTTAAAQTNKQTATPSRPCMHGRPVKQVTQCSEANE